MQCSWCGRYISGDYWEGDEYYRAYFCSPKCLREKRQADRPPPAQKPPPPSPQQRLQDGRTCTTCKDFCHCWDNRYGKAWQMTSWAGQPPATGECSLANGLINYEYASGDQLERNKELIQRGSARPSGGGSPAVDDDDELLEQELDEDGNPVMEYDENGFGIENGVLVGYKGKGRDVHIPIGVTAIGQSAFSFEPITAVHIPDSVTAILRNAFCNCKNLSAVYIPDSVTQIRTFAFGNCEKLADISVPAGVKIGKDAFIRCPGKPKVRGKKAAQTASPAAASRGPKFCSECGAALSGAPKFCRNCGTKLSK